MKVFVLVAITAISGNAPIVTIHHEALTQEMCDTLRKGSLDIRDHDTNTYSFSECWPVEVPAR